MFQILVVEDNVNANRLTSAILRTAGYTVISAFNGVEALEKLESNQIDLIVTDIMMPMMDGYQLTTLLRETKHTLPILMLTAKEQALDKYKGFDVGIDDYITKPYDQQELLLRIKALLRRAKIVSERKIIIGDIEINYDTLSVTKGDDVQTLPPKEFYLLYKLLSYPNKIFTRIQLLDEIWGPESISLDNTITVHINRLRTRFQEYDEFELVSVRGLGYKAVKKC